MKYIFSLALLAFFACNPARKIERAEQTVLLRKASFDKVGKQWMELHPCANDTVAVWIPGGVDSIPYPVPIFDSAAYFGLVDSMNTEGWKAFSEGYNQALKELKGKKVAVKRADTVLNVVVDKQKQKVYLDSIQSLNVQLAKANGQILEKEKQIKHSEKKTFLWIWLCIAAIAVGIFSHASKFFKL